MNQLEQIVAHKRKEIAENKSLYPVKKLEQSIYFDSPTLSLKEYLGRPGKAGIIAEFKRKSPSRGMINAYAPVERTSIGYMQAGASALSVLTDQHFFGGSNGDLVTARKFNYCPILRKDFILEEYQVLEARSIGADVILLIAAILSWEEISALSRFAHSLGLEVLLEIREEQELGAINQWVDIVGVNNRDLRTFSTDIRQSLRLAGQIPRGITKISESGISHPAAIARLKAAGYQGFLIGEAFMKNSRPEQACAQLIRETELLTANMPAR